MVCKKAFKNFVLAICFIFTVVFIFPINVYAGTETYGNIWEWTGDIAFSSPITMLQLEETYTQNFIYDESNINAVETTTTYKGTANLYADFQGTDRGYVNGVIYFPITFQLTDSSVTQYHITASLETYETDTIRTWSSIKGYANDYISVWVYVEFINHNLTGSDRVPLNFDVVYTSMVNSNQYGVIGCKVFTPTRSDWAGSLAVYSDIRDIPGYLGDYAKQNDTIIGKLDELINTIKVLLFGSSSDSTSMSLSEGGVLEQNNTLQEEANTLQEEANETSKNIFEKITDFFDNFFSRLGDFLLNIIVPTSEQLTEFLDRVNAWFSERLGFIWYPFSLAVDMVSALAGGAADTGFTVPAFKLSFQGTEYTIWGDFSVDLDAFGVFKYVRIFTSFIICGATVSLAVKKWDDWIGGRRAQ